MVHGSITSQGGGGRHFTDSSSLLIGSSSQALEWMKSLHVRWKHSPLSSLHRQAPLVGNTPGLPPPPLLESYAPRPLRGLLLFESRLRGHGGAFSLLPGPRGELGEARPVAAEGRLGPLSHQSPCLSEQ